jgi:hypothetical protein
MKCPQCIAESLRSTVTLETSLEWVKKQWDEDGVEVPETGRYKQQYYCSKGHRWSSDEAVNDPDIQAIVQ